MEKNIINSNSNNNNILLEIINDLNQLMNDSHDDTIIKRLGDVINKIK